MGIRRHTLTRHLAVMLAGLMLAATPVKADTDDGARQYKLEAAFLYNFFNYITWPGYSTPDELLKATICVAQGDPIEPYLMYIQQKMEQQRQLTIHLWTPGTSADDCNLFFTRSDVTLPVKHTPMLTVSNDAKTKPVSMITMHATEGRMALTIDNSALAEQGFQASSRLLSLAQEVK